MNTQKIVSKQDRMLPPQVAAVLSIRDDSSNQCPEEILRRIDSLKLGKGTYQFKANIHPSTSNGSLSSVGTPGGNPWRSPKGFRSQNERFDNRDRGDRDNRDRGDRDNRDRGDRPITIRRVGSDHFSPREDDSPNRRFRGSPSNQLSESPNPMPLGGRYVSSIVSDKKVEDRIIGHIRAKLNKFSQNNYEAVKSFLEQIMNSGETEFISEFMDLLFMKAASEEIYCELYARLISELTERFPHLKTEINTIYSNFLLIFKEARDVPDQGTADYTKFLEAQQRKKFRIGYSHFLSELHNKNLLDQDAIDTTITIIMDSLDSLESDATNTLLVEEYLASLYRIVTTLNCAKSAPVPPYIVNLVEKLKSIKDKSKEATPGYTVKARFKVMDIIDVIPN